MRGTEKFETDCLPRPEAPRVHRGGGLSTARRSYMSMTAIQNNKHLQAASRAAAGLIMLAGPLMAGGAAPGESWRDVFPASETYWDYEVSIGLNGSRVFTDTGWFQTRTMLYSSAPSASASPLWESVDPVRSLFRSAASADKADVHAVVRQEQDVANQAYATHLEVFNSATATPILNWFFPQAAFGNGRNRCDVSPDGRWIAAATVVFLDVHLVVFDLASTAPGTPVLDTHPGLFGQLTTLSISSDGQRVYLASKQQGRVLDVGGGPDLFSEYFFDTRESEQSFARNGSAFSLATGEGLKVYTAQGSGFGLAQEFKPYAWGASQQSWLTALSSDGHTVVAAFITTPTLQAIEVFAWDVLTGTELLHDILVGSASFDNVPTGIDIDDSGLRFALSSTGDGAGSLPELTVWEFASTGAQYERLAEFDLGGSIGALDLSGDGVHLACTGRDSHFNEPSGAKFVAVFDLGADLTVSGLAQAGLSVEFEFYPKSGPFVYLAMSPSAAPTPVSFGSVGTLFLNRSGLSLLPMGSVDATGRARLDFPIPSAMAGQTLYFQGYSAGPRRLSQTWIPLSIQ